MKAVNPHKAVKSREAILWDAAEAEGSIFVI